MKNLLPASIWETGISFPEDGVDFRTAASIEAPYQKLLNRTEHLYQGGALKLRNAATINALKALAGMINGEQVYVPGYGLYTYSSASAAVDDGKYIIQPTSGGGRWLLDLVSLTQGGGLTVATGYITDKLGIGKANPAVPLDVVGAGSFTGMLTASGGLTLADDVSKRLVLGRYNNTTAQWSYVSPSALSSGLRITNAAQDINIFELANSGALTLSGGLAATSGAFSSALSAASGAFSGSLAAGTDLAGANLLQRAQAGWADVLQVFRGGVLKWALQDSGGSAKITSDLILTGSLFAPLGAFSTGARIGAVDLGAQGFGIGFAGNSDMRIGQDATHNLVLGWVYNAASEGAYSIIETYGGANPILMQRFAGNVNIGYAADQGYKLAVNGSALMGSGSSFLSGNAASNCFVGVGRTGMDGLLASAGSAAQFLADATVGDFLFRIENSAKAFRFGPSGGANSWATLSSAGLALSGLTSGNAKLGTSASYATMARFMHSSQAEATGYALLQSDGGDTYLNAASGSAIYIRNNNLNVAAFTATGLGIGRSDPLAPLHIAGTNGRFILEASNVAGAGATRNLWRFALRETAEGNLEFQHYDGAAYSSQFGADAAGNLYEGGMAAPNKLSAKYAPIGDICRVRLGANGNVPSGAFTYLTWTDKVLDTEGTMWAAGDPTKVYARKAGIYRVSVRVMFPSNATGTRVVAVEKNASQASRADLGGNGSAPTTVSMSFLVTLAAGDYLKVNTYQDSGTTLNVATSDATFLELEYLRPS